MGAVECGKGTCGKIFVKCLLENPIVVSYFFNNINEVSGYRDTSISRPRQLVTNNSYPRFFHKYC